MGDGHIGENAAIALPGQIVVKPGTGLAARAESACDAAIAGLRKNPGRVRALSGLLAGLDPAIPPAGAVRRPACRAI